MICDKCSFDKTDCAQKARVKKAGGKSCRYFSEENLLTYEAFSEWWDENGGRQFIGCDRWSVNPKNMAWKAWEEAIQRNKK